MAALFGFDPTQKSQLDPISTLIHYMNHSGYILM